MRPAGVRRAAAACATAVLATLLLPATAAGQTGRSLPAPPGTGDAGFRLAVALLEAADELYRNAIVSDATWSRLSSRYDTHELASIVMTVATYRFVSMTLNAFGVQLRPDDEGFPTL